VKEICEIIRFWEARRGQPLALATLVSAKGSSYRRPGARMLIDTTGGSAGGVSAGCIEDEVAVCASQVLATGLPQLMTFDTRLRFGCHGTIEIFIEPVLEDLLAELRECVIQRQSFRLETSIQGDVRGTRIAGFEPGVGSLVQTIEPVLRLILIGDGSDTVALRSLAALLGWDVLPLDAPPVRSELLDERTAVVVATHNFGRDCAALRDLLPVGLKYLGLVGSRRRRDDLLFDVMDNGVECRSSLYAPAGLHLGADGAEEIALSIVAEIQSVFGSGTAAHLRDRKAPIHQPASGAVRCVESAA
jgi:xanthine/CO dehydrogenase XdhC/CoxF family maturation factor